MTNLGSPVRVLYPTVESSMPSAPPNSPFSMAPEDRPVITVMPKIAVQNSSGGPKRMANSAMGGENRIMTTTPKTPPISELTKTVYSASCALPCFAMG